MKLSKLEIKKHWSALYNGLVGTPYEIKVSHMVRTRRKGSDNFKALPIYMDKCE